MVVVIGSSSGSGELLLCTSSDPAEAAEMVLLATKTSVPFLSGKGNGNADLGERRIWEWAGGAAGGGADGFEKAETPLMGAGAGGCGGRGGLL